MSNTDSFIDEVTEEVRRDRLYAAFRKWGWVGVVLVLLIVGGAAWYEWQKARAAAAAQAAGDALLDAMALPEPAERAAAIAATGATDPIALLLSGGQEVLAGDTAAAIATLDALAADATQPQLYRDLAALRSLMLQTGATPPEDRIARLQPLAIPGATFAPLAQEQIALAWIEAGDTAAARAMLETILADAATPQGLRGRAEALMLALGSPEAEAAQD